VLDAVLAGQSFAQIEASLPARAARVLRVRAKYLLYEP